MHIHLSITRPGMMCGNADPVSMEDSNPNLRPTFSPCVVGCMQLLVLSWDFGCCLGCTLQADGMSPHCFFCTSRLVNASYSVGGYVF